MKSNPRELGVLALLAIGAIVFLFVTQSGLSPEGGTTATPSVKPVVTRGPLDLSDRSRIIVSRPELFSPGFNLVSIHETERVALIDMQGRLVHQWDFDAARTRLLPTCNVLVVHGTVWGNKREPWKNLLNRVREFDWDGKLVWEHITDDVVHHDAWRLANGNTLFLEEDRFTASDLLGQGEEFELIGDYVREVTSDGEIVWEWRAKDVLDPKSCGWKTCDTSLETRAITRRRKDWTHGNSAALLPENKWFDAGDTRFRPGNLLFLARNFWTAFIFDRDSGQEVWRYEGEHAQDPMRALIRGHEANMIEKGMPGAGNIIVFDNGSPAKRPYSRVLEIRPDTNEVVWEYQHEQFFSRAGGAAQRLANGNTLISADTSGRLFEVTPEKQIAWEMKFDGRIARARRYAPGYCSMLTER